MIIFPYHEIIKKLEIYTVTKVFSDIVYQQMFKGSSVMFHHNVSLSSSVGAAHGQHFDDDTPQRAPAGWSFTGVKLRRGREGGREGWKIPTEERDNSGAHRN